MLVDSGTAIWEAKGTYARMKLMAIMERSTAVVGFLAGVICCMECCGSDDSPGRGGSGFDRSMMLKSTSMSSSPAKMSMSLFGTLVGLTCRQGALMNSSNCTLILASPAENVGP